MYDNLLVVPIFLPVIAGVALLIMKNKLIPLYMYCYVMSVLAISACCIAMNLLGDDYLTITLFELMKGIPVYFKLDEVGKVYSIFVTVVWIVVGIYGIGYLSQEKHKNEFYGYYLILYGFLIGSHYAGNIVTFYIFYELLTLISVPLVLFKRTKEAKMAALKYMFFSFLGAYMLLYGVYFTYEYSSAMEFMAGNSVSVNAMGDQKDVVLFAVFLMICGFTIKAGMFPFHSWLWAAHPVAPAPASAVLSAIITKTGIHGIIRVIYYIVGPDFIRGTWVQYLFLTLSIFTLLMGSMLAYREKILKKRLAYSSISQVSYILFGLALLSPVGLIGALLQLISHACVKSTLFLSAGSILHVRGKSYVDELVGIGKEMPFTMTCYTIASLALVGIPLTSGFITKWYLAIAGLSEGIAYGLSTFGAMSLMASALLTAGYLLPVAVKGFFPGPSYTRIGKNHHDRNICLILPLVILTIIIIVIGIFPNFAISYFTKIASMLV
ncbi:MAG: proton-conducting transporter membrane subunit [Eubacteriales bacterium]